MVGVTLIRIGGLEWCRRKMAFVLWLRCEGAKRNWQHTWAREKSRGEQLPLNARRSTLAARRSTLNAQRSTLNAQRSTLNAQRSTLNAQRSTLNAQRSTLNAQRSTL